MQAKPGIWFRTLVAAAPIVLIVLLALVLENSFQRVQLQWLTDQ